MKEILKNHIKPIIVVSILLIICNLLEAFSPYIIKQILDVDFFSQDIINIIIRLIILYSAVHIMIVILKNLDNIIINKTICSILNKFRVKVFDKVLNFKMITYNKYNSAELYTRLTEDVNSLFDLFFGLVYMIVSNGMYIIAMIIMMFVANVNLALIGISTIFLSAVVAIESAKKLGRIDNEILKKRDKENKQFSELYNKNKLTYLFKLQKKNIADTNKLLYSELKQRNKYTFVHHFPLWILTLVQAMGIYAIVYYVLNININISVGSIYLVLYYIKECRTPLVSIFNKLEELQTCINSYKRIKNLLNESNDENIQEGEIAQNLNGDIEFQNVSMKYDKEEILHNISFLIKSGTKVTIAGRTGAGKTTLTNVLMKLYDIQDGRILIGEHDISKISTKSLRENISYISQNPYIFSDTVRNNITLGNKKITDEQINNLIHEMGVERVFDKLKNGLDTKIKLCKLSYGELQIIAFIRAILYKANIYIFDEPTSNIDLKTEKMIQNIIDRISKKSTVIIIAHRKSTIESSDKIIYLKNGKIDMIVNK